MKSHSETVTAGSAKAASTPLYQYLYGTALRGGIVGHVGAAVKMIDTGDGIGVLVEVNENDVQPMTLWMRPGVDYSPCTEVEYLRAIVNLRAAVASAVAAIGGDFVEAQGLAGFALVGVPSDRELAPGWDNINAGTWSARDEQPCKLQ